MKEHDLIHTYFAPLTCTLPGAFGLTDDAAMLDIPAGHSLICTTDALTEGVHFFSGDAPYTLAQKLMGVNLSDLAAMGAKPYAYLLTLHLPRSTTPQWLEQFSKGLKDMLSLYGGALAGGDTTCHDGPLCMSLTAMGTVPFHCPLKRSTAKAGDHIYVSGTIGDAYAGLQYLKAPSAFFLSLSEQVYLTTRYHVPTPRTELGLALQPLASSCIDVSDGLLADLQHICRQSNVGATLLLPSVPLSVAARSSKLPLLNLITGGDDYELLFTIAPEKVKLLPHSSNLALTHIGHIVESTGHQIILLDAEGRTVPYGQAGYTHLLK